MSSSDKKRRLASVMMTALKERRSLTVGEIMTVEPAAAMREADAQVELFNDFGDRLPAELEAQRQAFKARLAWNTRVFTVPSGQSAIAAISR